MTYKSDTGLMHDIMGDISGKKEDIILEYDYLGAGAGSGEGSFAGIVAAYDFSENDGKILTDISGNGNDGTAYGNTILLMNFDGGDADDLSVYDHDGVITGADCNAEGAMGYGKGCSFNGGTNQIALSNLNVDTSAGAKNTVEFWMYWDGTNSVMPFGWGTSYDLWFYSSCFGFNTGQGNILGISSAGFENNWIHVAAIFYNGVPDVSNNELYINGIKKNHFCMLCNYECKQTCYTKMHSFPVGAHLRAINSRAY